MWHIGQIIPDQNLGVELGVLDLVLVALDRYQVANDEAAGDEAADGEADADVVPPMGRSVVMKSSTRFLCAIFPWQLGRSVSTVYFAFFVFL